MFFYSLQYKLKLKIHTQQTTHSISTIFSHSTLHPRAAAARARRRGGDAAGHWDDERAATAAEPAMRSRNCIGIIPTTCSNSNTLILSSELRGAHRECPAADILADAARIMLSMVDLYLLLRSTK